MKAITDDESRSPTLRLQYAGYSPDTVISGSASLFGDNVVDAHTMLDQILSSDFCFRKIGIGSITAGRDDRLRHPCVVQLERMIEPRFKHGRGPAVILGCSEDNDGIRRAHFVAGREITDLTV